MSSIQVPPPNVGPEPPGFTDAVARAFSGKPTPAADPYDLTDPKLVELLTDTRKFCESGREVYEWSWWRNIQYFLGRQWIYFHPTKREWRDVRLHTWIPKPVTNKIRETEQSIRAMLSDIDPGVSVRPIGRSADSILTAQVLDDEIPVLHEEHDMDTALPDADYWAILLGNVFLHPCWDKDNLTNTTSVALDVCLLCGTESGPDEIIAARQRCPKCNSAMLRPATNPDGSPKMRQDVVGAGKTLVVSPLELLLPFYAQKFKDVDRLVYFTWRPRHQVEDEYGADVTRRVQWTRDPGLRSLQLYRALAFQSDLPLEPSLHDTGAFGADGADGVTEQHLWIRPGKRYPGGLYMRFLGDSSPIVARTTDSLELPYDTKDGKKLWPWVHYAYEPVGGRLFAQSAVDLIIKKQDSINQTDSTVELALKRMGNPIWLEPKGAEVERFTGQPGLVVKWQPAGAQGAKPERISGENPPQGFFTVREQYLNDIQELTGTYDIVKGAKPSGVEAFAALQLMVERGQSRFSTLFKGRAKAYRQWAELAVELERTYGPTERVKEIMGPNGGWIFEKYERANILAPVKIVTETGSSTPKTTLGRRAAIQHLSQLQALQLANDPEQLFAVMEEFGTTSLVPSLDADVKSALEEQDQFEQWAAAGFQGPMPLVRMPWHNDRVHLAQNRKWMNSDRVRDILRAADPQVQPLLIQGLGAHLDVHAQSLMQTMAPAPGAAPPGAAGNAQALATSNQNAGSSNTANAPPGQDAV